MKRIVAISGTLVIVAIIIVSGSAVAAWVYAIDYWEEKCTSPWLALYDPDYNHSTVGTNVPPTSLGILKLDLGAGNEMGPGQDFTVFASSIISEIYGVKVYTPSNTTGEHLWFQTDTADHDFTTPSTDNMVWRYIEISGITGSTGVGDPIYGPEIDAVGWDKP